MYTFLLIILIVDSLVLVAAILLQAAKGGGLAASFGGVTTAADAFIGTRQAGNVLTKTTWWSGGIFMGLAFVLQIMSAHTQAPKSVLDQPVQQQTAPSTTPTAPPGQTNPAVPLAPTGKGAPPAGKSDSTRKP